MKHTVGPGVQDALCPLLLLYCSFFGKERGRGYAIGGCIPCTIGTCTSVHPACALVLVVLWKCKRAKRLAPLSLRPVMVRC